MSQYAALARSRGYGEKTGRVIKLKDILNFISMMIFAAVIFSGTTKIAPLKKELLVVGGMVCLVSFFITNQKIRIMNVTAVIWLYVIMYMLASSMLNSNMSKTIIYVLMYMASFIVMVTGFSKKDYLMFIKICEIFAAVFCATVLLEFFICPLFTNYLIFLMDTPSRAASIRSEMKIGIFSGLSGEKGEASYAANILISIQLCQIFVRRKASKKNIALLLLAVFSLLMSGKRTMLMMPLVITLAFFFVNKIKGRVFKLIAAAVIVGISVYILTMIFPPLAITIDRIFNSSSDDMLTGRGDLWNVCKNMFVSNPLFGRGFASFNTFANRDYNVNVMMAIQNHEKWLFHAHSLYYQFLGELGLFGSIPAFSVILYSCIGVLRLRKNMDQMSGGEKIIYHFSLYYQLWFIIYGFTSNVGYYPQDLIMYFLCVSMYLYLKHRFKPMRKPVPDEINTIQQEEYV